MHADPQTRARGMVMEVEHTAAGRVETLGPPVKFSATPGGVRAPAPRLGEHTEEVRAAVRAGRWPGPAESSDRA
jgi:crotonobetainyl-CoA:carnitine CoA-transferase CaiB-like acyl-CoA transferase